MIKSKTEFSYFELQILRVLDDRLQGLSSDQKTTDDLTVILQSEPNLISKLESLLSKIAEGELRFEFPVSDAFGSTIKPGDDVYNMLNWFYLNLGLRLTKYKSISCLLSGQKQRTSVEQPFADEADEGNSVTLEDVNDLYSKNIELLP